MSDVAIGLIIFSGVISFTATFLYVGAVYNGLKQAKNKKEFFVFLIPWTISWPFLAIWGLFVGIGKMTKYVDKQWKRLENKGEIE